MIVLMIGSALHRDPELRRLLIEAGVEPRSVTARRALTDAGAMTHGVAILLGVPRGNGERATTRVRRLRAANVRCPILLVVGGEIGAGCEEALRAGASDFVARRRARSELALRLQALCQRASRPSRPCPLAVGDVEVDLSTRLMRCGDRTVLLTNREFRLFERLAAQPGEPIPRGVLEQHVWGRVRRGADGRPSNIVDVYVAYLRRKLNRVGSRGAVRTLRGVGYAIQVDDSRED